MIDKAKKYKTRSGDDVRIYATDGGGAYAVHGARLDSSLGWQSERWMPDGRYALDPGSRFGLIPVPALRPWTAEDAPMVVMLRPKESHKEPRPRVWRSQGGGFACCAPSGELASEGIDFRAALALYVRILEDGTEVPCGVAE